LPNTFPEPYYWIARIYHEKEDFKKALTAYYDAEQNLPKDNSNYFTTIILPPTCVWQKWGFCTKFEH
jgi:hypothetical protein